VALWPSGPPPAEAERPPADAATLRSASFGSVAATFRADGASPYLDDVREPLALFRDGGAAHPGWLLRFANSILVANVVLGPRIHTESLKHHHVEDADGDRVETRALVTDLHERRGHQLVDLDVLQLVGDRPVARIAHTAIYRLREGDSPV
jgi:acyl-coenzyme A thioesterase PaaI-like protein